MNFIVSSSYLLKNLSSISGVITSNPVVPILENVLFEIDNGNLLITASDLQTSVMVELQVESKENGSVAIPAKILIDTLKNLPEQPVTFSIDESNYNIEINSGTAFPTMRSSTISPFSPGVVSTSFFITCDAKSSGLVNLKHPFFAFPIGLLSPDMI